MVSVIGASSAPLSGAAHWIMLFTSWLLLWLTCMQNLWVKWLISSLSIRNSRSLNAVFVLPIWPFSSIMCGICLPYKHWFFRYDIQLLLIYLVDRQVNPRLWATIQFRRVYIDVRICVFLAHLSTCSIVLLLLFSMHETCLVHYFGAVFDLVYHKAVGV